MLFLAKDTLALQLQVNISSVIQRVFNRLYEFVDCNAYKESMGKKSQRLSNIKK